MGVKKSFHALTVNSIKWHDRQAMRLEGKIHVAIKILFIQFIQFNVCYLVLFVCSFNSFNSMCVTWCCLYVCLRSKQTYKQHQVTHIELNFDGHNTR